MNVERKTHILISLKVLIVMASSSEPSGVEDPQAAIAVLLDVLFAAKIEPVDAFACAKALYEGGVRSREHLASLTQERAKQLTPKKVHKKLLAALKKDKLPSLEDHASGSEKRQRTKPPSVDGPPPSLPPPPPPPPGVSGPSVDVIVINRSPVMILWAAAAAVELGYDWPAALSLGSACAALFARAKGRSIGLYAPGSPSSSFASYSRPVRLLGQLCPADETADGVRGFAEHKTQAGRFDRVQPLGVYRSLASAYGGEPRLGAAWSAMRGLAAAMPRGRSRATRRSAPTAAFGPTWRRA